MSRPTVAFVAHEVHDHGGMERAAAELLRRGHERCQFVVVSSALAPELRPVVEWRRVRIPARPAALRFATFWALAGRALRGLRADVVHVLGAIVPGRADLATVQFCHAGFRAATGSLAPAGSPPVRRLNTALAHRIALAAERRCYRPGRVRMLAAVSAGVARELERHYPSLPVVVTPNGVDCERFRPPPSRPSRDRITAVFVGGDWDRKGLGIAIEALAAAPGVALDVVGAGDVTRFRAIASRYGVAERVRFLGPRQDVERVLQASDVIVLPTLYETFSLAAHEAAASGLPVVATPVHGVAELVGDGEAGLIVERTRASVGAALAQLAADPALRSRLGAEARRRALELDWDRSVASILDAYDSLLGAPTPEVVPA
jgi:glycosyltransferase involved in cell wall biosynthesis